MLIHRRHFRGLAAIFLRKWQKKVRSTAFDIAITILLDHPTKLPFLFGLQPASIAAADQS